MASAATSPKKSTKTYTQAGVDIDAGADGPGRLWTMIRAMNPRPAILLVGALFALAVLGCNNEVTTADSSEGESGQDPAPAATQRTPAAFAGPPRMAFTALAHDFGSVPESTIHDYSFEFTNVGGEVLIIHEVKPACTCIKTEIVKKRYQPGETGHIQVTFAPASVGQLTTLISIASNSNPTSIIKLRVTAKIDAFLTLNPEPVMLGKRRLGQEHRVYVTLSSVDENTVYEGITTTNLSVTPRILPIGADIPGTVPPIPPGGRVIEIVISDTAPWGPIGALLEIRARGTPPGQDQPVLHRRTLRVQGQLFGELEAEPDIFRAGVPPGGSFQRAVRLTRPSGKPFNVLSVNGFSAALQDVSAQFKSVAPNAYDIVLSARGLMRPGMFRGTVNVTTDVPGEEQLVIRIAGRVFGPAG